MTALPQEQQSWSTTPGQLEEYLALLPQIGLGAVTRLRWLDIYRWVYRTNGWVIPHNSLCSMSSTPKERAAEVISTMRWIAGLGSPEQAATGRQVSLFDTEVWS